MEECIFCKIVAGTAPSYTIYEDEYTMAFLDIAPVTRGQTVVISKSHYPNMLETPDEVLAALIKTVKQVGTKLQERLGADGINLINNTGSAAEQMIDHIHMNVIPRYEDDGLEHWKPSYTYQDGEREKLKKELR